MLLYGLEQGPSEDTILKQSSRTNTPIPDRIANAPQLLVGLELYYTGFQTLSSSRSSSFSGDGPIPWHIMLAYCSEYEIEGEQREYFYDMVRALDKAYLSYSASKRIAAQLTQPARTP